MIGDSAEASTSAQPQARKASQSARDASVRQLLDKLAEAEDLALFAMLGQLPFPLLRVGRGRFFDYAVSSPKCNSAA